MRVMGLVLAWGLLAGAFAGCGKNEPGEAGRTADGKAAAVAPGGLKTITVAQLADLVGFNELLVPPTPIHTGILYYGLFVQLLEEQANYQSGPAAMKPRLAESWEFSPDRLTLTFKLRPGVLWSDGEPLTAEDVLFTFEAQKTKEIGWHLAESKDRIAKVEVVDPLTVRYHFTEAYSTQLIDANEGVILPKHVWSKIPFKEWRENAAYFDQHLVTSGPFKVEVWQPQQRLVLVRNEKYFEPGVPKVDRVVVQVVPDEPNQVALLRAGTVDAIENVPAQNVAELEKDPDIELPTHVPRTYFDIIWNTSRPFLAEKEVRQALTMGIDRQAIVDSLLFGHATVGASPYPTSFWVRKQDLKPWPYDPERARQLLAERGFKDNDGDGILERGGKKFEIELMAPSENQVRRNVVLLAQESLKKVGVAVRAPDHRVQLDERAAPETRFRRRGVGPRDRHQPEPFPHLPLQGQGHLQLGRLLQSGGRPADRKDRRRDRSAYRQGRVRPGAGNPARGPAGHLHLREPAHLRQPQAGQTPRAELAVVFLQHAELGSCRLEPAPAGGPSSVRIRVFSRAHTDVALRRPAPGEFGAALVGGPHLHLFPPPRAPGEPE